MKLDLSQPISAFEHIEPDVLLKRIEEERAEDAEKAREKQQREELYKLEKRRLESEIEKNRRRENPVSDDGFSSGFSGGLIGGIIGGMSR